MITCNDLKNIKTPTLIMTGERTVLFFKTINNELDKCLTNKEKIILANASHGLEMENPVDFNKIVLAFIDKN
jgi:pimeloyl-ACP methyl ester carboxylesterase